MAFETLHAGVARADITPELGTYLFGYPVQDRRATSIHDPLFCTSLVVAHGATRAAIVSLDICLIEEKEIAKIRQRVEERCGLAPDNVTICASHTHTAPMVGSMAGWGAQDAKYLAQLMPRVVDCIVEANSNLEEARVGFASTRGDIGVNRRGIAENHGIGLSYSDWGVFDPTLTVAHFKNKIGAPLASIIHCGAHPTALSSADFVSRDWPGQMQDRFEKFTGAPSLYINGALGDVAPRGMQHAAVGDGWPAAQEVGDRAAHFALRAFDEIREFRDVPVRVLAQDFHLPNAPLLSAEDAEKLLEKTANHSGFGMDAAEHQHATWALEAHENAPQPHRVWRQSVTEIGPLAIVPIPGEAFSEIVLRIRDQSPFQYTLCASVSNGSHGYYVTREARVRGGYEVDVARAYGAYVLADNIDDYLVEHNTKLLRELHAE